MILSDVMEALSKSKYTRPAEASANSYVLWSNLVDISLDAHNIEIAFVEGGLDLKLPFIRIHSISITAEKMTITWDVGHSFHGVALDGGSLALRREEMEHTKDFYWLWEERQNI